jgi:D-glycero-D-manno-heptose 1,7-bisphosphate phosphatase
VCAVKRPAVFLDRDGTLIEDRGYLSDPAAVEFYPGTIPALRRLASHFELFIVTNQAGIALGITAAEDVARVNEHVADVLARAGISLREVYCCPHSRDDGCLCRKPSPFFLLKAAEDHGIDLARSFVVGDHPHDVQCALNANARGILVLTGHGSAHGDEVPPGGEVVQGIIEAADLILGRQE